MSIPVRWTVLRVRRQDVTDPPDGVVGYPNTVVVQS